MKQRRISSLAALGLAAVTAVGAVGCAPAATELDDDRSLTIAVAELPIDNWDPSQGPVVLDGSLARPAVMSPLINWGINGEPIPALATELVVADDQKSVDITLREGVTFSDGVAMDAEGIKKFFDHALASDSFPFKATAAAAGAEFTVTGENTLTLSFSTPIFHPDYQFWDIIRLLLVTPVLSPASVDDQERATSESMSVGPYVVDEYVPEVSISFVRNPDFWDPESYPFETIELLVLADPIAQLNALKSGQVDAATLTIEQIDEAESAGFTIQSGTPTYWTLWVRDPESSPLEPLRDVRVRQAMMLAFDREQINETLNHGIGGVSSQAFIPGQPEYVEGGDERYGYDLDRARELMAEAGYEDGFDVVIPSGVANASVEPIVQQSLGDIGIRVTFEPFADAFELFTASFGGEYPLMLSTAYNINTFRLLDEKFEGIGSQFDAQPDIERLVPIIKFGDADESAAASQELGEIVLDQAWLIPFSRAPIFWASAPGIGVEMSDTFGGPWNLTGFVIAD